MFFYLSAFLLVNQAGSSTWEFGGHDDPAFIVLDQKTGRIKPFEYEKTVVFTIPNCTELRFVQVQVNNQLNDPFVSFKSSENSVPISYRPLQATMSSYDIVAKGIEKEDCVSNSTDGSNLEKFEEKWIIPGRGPKKPWFKAPRAAWG